MSLPGEEALQPAPPDPDGPQFADQVAGLPDGVLDGDVQLLFAGLAGFDEPVTGTCDTVSTPPTLAFALADGSSVTLRFERSGGELSVAAPGVAVEEVLRDVQMEVSGSEVTLDAELLTAGSSENSGDLTLQASCG